MLSSRPESGHAHVDGGLANSPASSGIPSRVALFLRTPVCRLVRRLRQGGGLLYRQPAYLICTHPDQPVQELLQSYLWRWDIEVNHRDEKQIIGRGCVFRYGRPRGLPARRDCIPPAARLIGNVKQEVVGADSPSRRRWSSTPCCVENHSTPAACVAKPYHDEPDARVAHVRICGSSG